VQAGELVGDGIAGVEAALYAVRQRASEVKVANKGRIAIYLRVAETTKGLKLRSIVFGKITYALYQF
jgi:thioredoxin reductase